MKFKMRRINDIQKPIHKPIDENIVRRRIDALKKRLNGTRSDKFPKIAIEIYEKILAEEAKRAAARG